MLRPSVGVTQWLCGGLQIRIRGFDPLSRPHLYFTKSNLHADTPASYPGNYPKKICENVFEKVSVSVSARYADSTVKFTARIVQSAQPTTVSLSNRLLTCDELRPK